MLTETLEGEIRTRLAGLLGEHFQNVSYFSINFIINCKTHGSSIEDSYGFLRGKGLSDGKIATHADLLGRDPETLQNNFNFLHGTLGLSPEKIASQAQLLGSKPKTLQNNFNFLHGTIGLSPKKIATLAHLLGRDPETLQNNFNFLHGTIGLSPEKIAQQAHLLGRAPKTIKRNFTSHSVLLRGDCNDKESGRAILRKQAQLLCLPPDTVLSNVQYLRFLGIGPKEHPMLLGTKASTKREKIAFILRGAFDYGNADREGKKEAMEKAVHLVRRSPELLLLSMSKLESRMPKLKQKAWGN